MTLLVIGMAAVDRRLAVARLPAAGETVLAPSSEDDLGGKGLNQAVAAARAGARVRLLATIGRDAAGAQITRLLRREGIESGHIRRAATTPLSLVFVLPDGSNAIVGVGQAEDLGAEVVAAAMDGLRAGDWLLVSGHLASDTLAFALAQARALGLKTALNLAPVPFDYRDLWPAIDLVIANAAELTMHTGGGELTAGIATLRAAGVRELLITLGAEGALLAAATQNVRMPAPKVAAVDTTGAGDLLAGTFLGLLERGIDRQTALWVAVEAAAAKISRPGTLSAFPERHAIDRLVAAAATQLRKGP